MRKLSVIAVWLTGCSFALVDKPPAQATAASECTESRIAPIADAVITAGLLVAGIAGVASRSHCTSTSASDCAMFDYSSTAQTAGTISLIGAAGFGLSTWIGFSATSRCRALHAGAP